MNSIQKRQRVKFMYTDSKKPSNTKSIKSLHDEQLCKRSTLGKLTCTSLVFKFYSKE